MSYSNTIREQFLDELIESGFYEDALNHLRFCFSENSIEHYFYLGFLQAQLGQTEEAMETLQKCKSIVRETDLESTVSGLLADVYDNENWIGDAIKEINHAVDLEPDCPLIQRKQGEIFEKFHFYFIMMIKNYFQFITQLKRGKMINLKV